MENNKLLYRNLLHAELRNYYILHNQNNANRYSIKTSYYTRIRIVYMCIFRRIPTKVFLILFTDFFHSPLSHFLRSRIHIIFQLKCDLFIIWYACQTTRIRQQGTWTDTIWSIEFGEVFNCTKRAESSQHSIAFAEHYSDGSQRSHCHKSCVSKILLTCAWHFFSVDLLEFNYQIVQTSSNLHSTQRFWWFKNIEIRSDLHNEKIGHCWQV